MQTRPKPEIKDVVISSSVDAQVIIKQLYTLRDKFKIVTLEDYYDLVNIPAGVADRQWGWKKLDGIQMVQVPAGYRFIFPPLQNVKDASRK